MTVVVCFPRITQQMNVPWCWVSDVRAEEQCGGQWDAACRSGSGTAGPCNAALCSLGQGQQPAAHCSHHLWCQCTLCACCVYMHNYVCEQVLLAQSLLLCCIWFPFSSLQIFLQQIFGSFNSCCVVAQL